MSGALRTVQAQASLIRMPYPPDRFSGRDPAIDLAPLVQAPTLWPGLSIGQAGYGHGLARWDKRVLVCLM